jgi:adenylosuccinate synthase
MQIVVGAQWGDEGKGKIVDFLSESADFIVRYQGGNNAGHTVIVGQETFKLHLVPSGICRGKQSVLGNGVVINPVALAQEIKELEARGIEVRGKLWLSSRSHLILAEHIQRDLNQEEARTLKVGTTGKGIGPAYTDKTQRKGVRLGEWTYSETLSSEEHEALQFLDPLIADTTHMLHMALESGKKILLEGAQGTFLDLDHGTYPFVTSSNCSSGGACTGTGLPPTAIKAVNGILKAYTTRVGNGPFPTELRDDTGEFLQKQGHEFGTTTGRKRRCGWLDLVMANYARRINGIDRWSITKLDVLSGLPELKVCVDYRYKDQILAGYPAEIGILEGIEPVYETLPGWQDSLQNCRSLADLPENARNYLKFIEERTQTRICLVSWGPERSQTMILD